MHRAAENKAVGSLGLLNGYVHRIVKHALALAGTAAAGHAAAHRAFAHMEDLRFHPVLFQFGGDFRQGRIGAALLVGAAVDQQYVHVASLLFVVLRAAGAHFPPCLPASIIA